MNYISGNELRKKFLDFFKSKDHLILQSYPLIPENDPTLLLVGAGMAPFKPFFTGKMNPPHPRISTSQKCVRTGDIENVGRTARHHTFFEMLGNFSFGDYFKKEAIAWAWEFITEHLEMPKDKLWITIHTEDDEAFAIWHNDIHIPADRIIRMADNFWEIGPGPCGPCSEIYFDLGEERGCNKSDCAVGCDCDRFLEIWNLVFTQYDRDEAGNYTPLAKKNIDTGAGLERIASVLQNKRSNFETDLLFPLIEHAAKVANVEYGSNSKTDISLKVIADHIRSMTVMIGDGILPSNEGRGYVLRRILRRAVRHARLLGIEKIFLVPMVDIVNTIFAEAYPDLVEKQSYIKKVIQLEEERFQTTLVQGMELLNGHIQKLKELNISELDGATAFKLYDTFGFPWELTLEILEEHDMQLDKPNFDSAMKEQRERARAARQDHEDQLIIPDLSHLETEKLIVDEHAENGNIILAWKNGILADEVHDGEDVAFILDVTSFHAEGGGQIGDTGFLESSLGKMKITATKKLVNGTTYHVGNVTEGLFRVGDLVKLKVDDNRRRDIARNHTATHLLHAALKQVLGTHVNQSGSLVSSERLRFDFSHFSQVTSEQLLEIEKLVNHAILENISVTIVETKQDKAKEMGAVALFGEKYGETVRVVSVGSVSKELCGGSHVMNTSEICVFKIVSEAGIGSGIRRIEAVTGSGAMEYINGRDRMLLSTAIKLKSRPEELAVKVESVMNRVKELENELAALTSKLAHSEVMDLLSKVQEVNGVQVVVGQVSINDIEGLRTIADMVRDRLQCGVVTLGSIHADKVNFVAMATKEAIHKGIHAGNIVKEVSKITGGGGGGRPDMAQAGGKQPEKIFDALQFALEVIKNQVK
ncbi:MULTISPECIES: alanine--tRNA ligase [Pelosinus]|uniref:Alanine--tRNA ligase n=1 Tax=Pelosinus fermentans B4 TaxID=1149862 RepID=I9LDA4_9FIRM|nr:MULTISPECIES: alanine--tRNA ligase [Pelosinus]EIW18414.1 alanyl-tRNA synthetase [Pelosinus fermentans B4]EIW24427.1 alanyl-tRNA synthetase [Pelosinus fermentans A11]OAM94514.1 Alanine-tRNA ligase, eukaryota/bacteria [Pelosinus fermentans DSM 17108]SDR11073.1 alanyl-tRNA synthetase [Pelosinus fermentans]